MSVRTSCPFCNANVTDAPQSGRVTCPRCGESFPIKPGDDEAADLTYPAASANSEYEPRFSDAAPPSTVRAIGPIALLGLLFAALVIAGGLYGIFNTPSKVTAPVEKKPPATMPPAGVSGLAYLPGDSSIAFAIQFGPLLAYAERTNADPRQLLTDAGVPAQVGATLDRLGLRLDQIDQLCAGLVVANDNPFPRVFIALLLNRPVDDESALLRQLKATQFTPASGLPRFKGIDLGAFVPFELARRDGKTYLFATDGKDLDAIDRSIGRGSAHLPLGMKESMAKLSPASFAWAATDSTTWSEKPLVKLAGEMSKRPELPSRLTGIRAVALGLSLEPEAQLMAAVQSSSSDAASKLQEQLSADRSAKVERDGAWVTATGPIGSGKGEWFRGLLPKPKGK